MDRNEQVLSLIGLCLRGRNLEVGEEPVEAVSRGAEAGWMALPPYLARMASMACSSRSRRSRWCCRCCCC